MWVQYYKATKEQTVLTSRAHSKLYTAYVIKDEVSAYVQSRFIYVPHYYMACEDKKIIEHVASLMVQVRGMAYLIRRSINCSFCCFLYRWGKLIKLTAHTSLNHLSLTAFNAASAASVAYIPLILTVGPALAFPALFVPVSLFLSATRSSLSLFVKNIYSYCIAQHEILYVQAMLARDFSLSVHGGVMS